MDTQLVALIASTVLTLVNRHYQETGEILTDDMVQARLKAEIADTDTTIARWFEEKGLPAPE